MKKRPEVVLVLNDLRSAHNVGSIFRTSDAAGVSKLYLVGYTPAPVDKFGRANKEIAKTALGAEKSISWEKVEDFFSLIKKLKKENFTIVALEQDSKSLDYKKFKSPEKIAYIEYPQSNHFMIEEEWNELWENVLLWFEKFIN